MVPISSAMRLMSVTSTIGACNMRGVPDRGHAVDRAVRPRLAPAVRTARRVKATAKADATLVCSRRRFAKVLMFRLPWMVLHLHDPPLRRGLAPGTRCFFTRDGTVKGATRG